MPRPTVRALPTILLGAVVGLGACAAPDPLAINATRLVTITTSCWDTSVAFQLSPWDVDVQQGDQVEWAMASPAQGVVGEYYIVPESAKSWPYPQMLGKSGKGKGKALGRPTVPLPSKNMRAGVPENSRYKYQIEYYCYPEGSTDSLKVVIDPDVVVDRRQ